MFAMNSITETAWASLRFEISLTIAFFSIIGLSSVSGGRPIARSTAGYWFLVIKSFDKQLFTHSEVSSEYHTSRHSRHDFCGAAGVPDLRTASARPASGRQAADRDRNRPSAAVRPVTALDIARAFG
jgi:hypothetical protein